MQAIANHFVVLSGWRRFLVAVIAGALSALALAPFNFLPVLWLTTPVFVWLIDGATAREGAGFLRRLLPAAAVGWAFGFGYFLAGLWWVGAAFLVDADEFAALLPVAVLLLPAGLALFWAFGAALARLAWTEGWPRVLVFALAMTLAEWLRGHVLTGFPWNAFGYGLTPLPVLMQSASLIGLWGLTLAAFIIFASPAALTGGHVSRRGSLIFIASALALFVLDIGYGAFRLASASSAMVPNVHLRIVQPDIPQNEKWLAEKSDATLTKYLTLSSGSTGPDRSGLANVTHLIWPESAFPFFLTDRPDALGAIGDLLPPGTTLITGAARADPYTTDDSDPRVFNSAYIIDDQGVIRDAYDKVDLVPFGEYLPLRGVLESLGLRQVIALPGGFSPGPARRTLDVPNAPPAGLLICYEIIFPGTVTEAGHRPGWLVNLTNDAWYGNTPGPYQHLLQARVRAVEEGLPVARAANSGISAVVDPYGRIVTSLALGATGILDSDLPAALPPTPYATAGDSIFLVVFLIVAALAGISRAVASRRRN